MEPLTVHNNESYILMKEIDDHFIGTFYDKEKEIVLHLLKTLYI